MGCEVRCVWLLLFGTTKPLAERALILHFPSSVQFTVYWEGIGIGIGNGNGDIWLKCWVAI
jgi:hypothetical protein